MSKKKSGAIAKKAPPKPKLAAVVGVTIGQVPVNGNMVWTILPEDDLANHGRFTPYIPAINAGWASRHGKGPTPGTDHRPIIFNEGDTVQFISHPDYDIAIGVHKNPDVDDFTGSPDDPLIGITGLQLLAKGATPIGGIVKSSIPTPGPKHQGFYKFYGWVNVAGTFIPIDPDGYCGG